MSAPCAIAVAALALAVATDLNAQTPPTTTPDSAWIAAPTAAMLIARADSLYDRGARDEARRAYRDVLAADERSSRAIYRLATLEPAGSDAAIELYRRYVELEADDAWGWIALGEALADAGDADEAISAYERAIVLAPHERDAVIARARLLLIDQRHDEARDALRTWTASHTRDVEAWRLRSRAHRALGELDEELESLETVAALDPQDASRERLDALRARRAPAIEPSVAASTDSDGSSVGRVGLAGDISLGARSRLGLQLERATASDPETSGTLDRGLIYYSLRGDGFRLEARAGVGMREDVKGRVSRAIEPIGALRARWFPADAIGAELRLQRALLDANAAMIESGIVLEEAIGRLEIPAGDDLAIRLLAGGGALAEGKKRNWRVRFAGGPQVAVAEGVRVGLQYDGTHYTGRAKSGYFAPELAHTLEVTAYGELEELGALSIAADLGAGVQQIIEEIGDEGTISPALRGWGSVAWSFAPASSLALELEGYNLVGGSAVSGGGGGWSYGSVALALRWAL